MKKFSLMALAIFTGFSVCIAQNTFPTTGPVGIGTNAPSTFGALAVRAGISLNGKSVSASFSDNANSTLDIRHPYANIADISSQGSSLTFSTSPSSTDGIERLRITQAGNFSLGGVTPANADAAARTLQIGSQFIMQNVIGTQISLANNAYYDGTGWYTVNNAPASRQVTFL